MAEHTKGKLEISSQYSNPRELWIGANFHIATTHGTKSQTNANHLVHCWNAFEEGGLVDALLAACKLGLELAQKLNHPHEYHIEQAIAKAKEQK